jgi:nickel-dependent lactate racemase
MNGISKENILILVATGMHRPNQGEELNDLVGSKDIIDNIRIENHFANDLKAHVDLGKTSTGIPILIDGRFLEADIRIVTGLVEPHFMAGYSGGRKVIAPGISHQDTILGLHSPKLLEHPKAANCILDDNPLHKQQIEIIRAIGNIQALNVVIDEERRIGFVNFGDIESSHKEAVNFMRNYAEIKLTRRFKTIVTSSAGYPLDKTYYQTVKGMIGVIDILEPGGTVIIASECSEGIGSDDFIKALGLLKRLGPEKFLGHIMMRERAFIDEWEVEMLVKALNIGKIKIFSTGLKRGEFEYLYVDSVSSVEEGVFESIKEYDDNEIAVVPEGPYVIPVFEEFENGSGL